MTYAEVFREPDIAAGLENLDLEITTYPATAIRGDASWTVSVSGLPDGRTVQATGETYRAAEDAIQEVLPQFLDVDRTSLTVSVEPADPEARAALRTLTGARITRAKAGQAERDAARAAARLYRKQGWPTEDIATALRLPVDLVPDLLAPSEPASIQSNARRTTPRTPADSSAPDGQRD